MLLRTLYKWKPMYFVRHDFFGGKKRMEGQVLVQTEDLTLEEWEALEESERKDRPIRVRYRMIFPGDSFWDQEGWGELFLSGKSQYQRRLEHGPYLHLVGKNLRGNAFFNLKMCYAYGIESGKREMRKSRAADEEVQVGGIYTFEGSTDGTTSSITGSTSEDTSDGNSEKEPPIIYPPW